MKISLHLPDELFEHYVKVWGIPNCYNKMKEAVAAMKDMKQHDRYLIICGDVRRDIEATFQTTLDTPDKLAKLVKNLNSVKIEDVEMRFTPDELARIDMQASFHGRDRDTYIREMITEIKDRFLEKV